MPSIGEVVARWTCLCTAWWEVKFWRPWKAIWQYLLNLNACTLHGLPRWLSGKESAWWCKRCTFNPWVRKIPWSRKWQHAPDPVFVPGKFHEQSPAGYSLLGCKETRLSDKAHTHTLHNPEISLLGLAAWQRKVYVSSKKKKKGCFIASSIVFDITQTRNNPMSTNSRANKLVYSYGEMLYNYENEHRRQAYTWTPPDGQYQNQTDSTLCSQRWKSSIESAKTRLGAAMAQIMSSLLPNSDLYWRK